MAEREPNFLSDPADITAQELRTTYAHLQEGVLGANDLKVTVGAGRSVDVAAGSVLVQGDDITAAGQEQGLYLCANDATVNSEAFTDGGIDPPDANPRVDQIVAQLLDTDYDSSGERAWRLKVVKGSAASGAQITNPAGANYRAGAAALPGSACRLADVLVATDGSLTVVDRRPWARGAYLQRRIGTDGQILHSTDVTSYQDVSPEFSAMLEFSGAPVRVRITGRHATSSAGGNRQILNITWNGALQGKCFIPSNGLAGGELFSAEWTFVPTPGYHVFGFKHASSVSGSASRIEGITELVIEEIVRPNTSNG